MSKFIPPPDQINNISSKKSKKSFSDNSGQSILSELKKLVKESYSTDMFEQVGQMNAVVLEVRDIDVLAMLWRNPLMFFQFMMKGSIPDYFEIRFRIPELHAHLPEPKGPDDYFKINLHPLALMKKDKGMPEVGDIVTLDFQDKNNFKGAMVLETLNTNDPNKNPGGNCSVVDTPGSAAPPLNMTAPSGDSQASTPAQYSAKNSPAPEGKTQGISYPEKNLTNAGGYFVDTSDPTHNVPSPPKSFGVVHPDGTEINFTPSLHKPIIFTISIDEFTELSDFKNVNSMVSNLLSKKVAAVCFSVAEGQKRLSNLKLLRRIIKKLIATNIDVGLSISISDIGTDAGIMPQFNKNFIHMTEVVKSSKINFVIYDIHDNSNPSNLDKTDIIFRNFSNSLNIRYYGMVTHKTRVLYDVDQAGHPNFGSAKATIFPIRSDKMFAAANLYDYNHRGNGRNGSGGPERFIEDDGTERPSTPFDRKAPGSDEYVQIYSPYHRLTSYGTGSNPDPSITTDANFGYPLIPTTFSDGATLAPATADYPGTPALYGNPYTEKQYTNWLPMYHLDGANFIGTPNDPCLSGERTTAVLENDFNYAESTSGHTGHVISGANGLEKLRTQGTATAAHSQKHLIVISGYKLLTEVKSEFIYQTLFTSGGGAAPHPSIGTSEKQSFLSSTDDIKKTNKAEVKDVIGAVADIFLEEPQFNTGSSFASAGFNGSSPAGGSSTGGSSTQSADAAPAAEHDSKPGIQCTPIPTGPAPAPGAGGGDSAAVEAPSFRFDSIEDYGNLGWTANNGAAINNVIFDFMEKFSAAVYRRLPANSPAFTGSNPKKLRLTSTARTYQKQAELMWDKIKNGGGDSAVYSLYGQKKWTTAVVNAYHAGDMAAAVEAVRVRVEEDGGGSAHLKGKGVDIHTWSHINAEGMNSDGASIAQMNNSKFVQAVVEAAKEVGASPVVEAYQQHVHITIF